MTNPLEQLRKISTVVADTGDIDEIIRVKPTDATTNPSLVLAAAGDARFADAMSAAQKVAARKGSADGVDQLLVEFGTRIMNAIPRWVSTEVDASLSFHTDKTITRARSIIERYIKNGADEKRVLIKIAATWEGIQAARVLEAEGIACNMTLIFSAAQAAACADAGATLISPFVGRILDWYKAQNPDADFSGAKDPGVQSVKGIYRYYKENSYNTLVMGASFRNTSEIRELAGCDLLTIAPKLLDQISAETAEIPSKIEDNCPEVKVSGVSQPEFRFDMNEDAMATEKLAEGIRKFTADQRKLEAMVSG